MLAANAATWLIFYLLPEVYSFTWPASLIFIGLVYALSFLIFQKSLKANAEKSALVFLALTTGKMLLSMIYVLVLVINFEEAGLPDYLYFISLYLVFLTAEVVLFTKSLKPSSKTNTEIMS